MNSHEKFLSSIKPLVINKLSGRYLDLPSNKKKQKEILLLYGHHASIERMEGLALALNKFGRVCLPDFPGFGGMDSLYNLNKKPTLDNLAEYLASFIKIKYKNKKITVVALSFGFVVLVRMLELYPKMNQQVDLIVGGVCFLSHDEIKYKPLKKSAYRLITKISSYRVTAFFIRYAILNKYVIRILYEISERDKKSSESAEKKNQRINFEVKLWQKNDVKTHFYTLNKILKIDLKNAKINIPLIHIYVKRDQYLDHYITSQHLKAVFRDYSSEPVNSDQHAPTVVATPQEAMKFIPKKVQKILNS